MTNYTIQIGDTITINDVRLRIEHAEQLPKPEFTFQIVDRIAEFDAIVNPRPFHRDFVRCFPGASVWPVRDTITGITIHHTMSHSPVATARYCTRVKGYPTTQYTYWVSADDGCPVYQCLRDSVACWHDHTGRLQTTISVGMAGRLDVAKPPLEQIAACVNLCAALMRRYGLQIEQVKGHNDRYSGTVCPGWDVSSWRDDFYEMLRGRLNCRDEL